MHPRSSDGRGFQRHTGFEAKQSIDLGSTDRRVVKRADKRPALSKAGEDGRKRRAPILLAKNFHE